MYLLFYEPAMATTKLPLVGGMIKVFLIELNWFTTEGAGKRGSESNSKHWFTTSFLQPLPYLVTP